MNNLPIENHSYFTIELICFLIPTQLHTWAYKKGFFFGGRGCDMLDFMCLKAYFMEWQNAWAIRVNSEIFEHINTWKLL